MRDPDLIGIAGRAWHTRRPEEGSGEPSWQGHVNGYVIEVPGAHPWWRFWTVYVVHLWDIPGAPPAKKHFPEAAYEFAIFAHDPDYPVAVDPGVGTELHPLTPFDVCYQFAGCTDEQASRICDGAVRMILDGRMSPDQDYRSIWKTVIKNTVEHMTAGGHPTASA